MTMLVTVGCVSCSTQKNTATSRAFHQMKTKYNVLFNGRTAYTDGMNAIANANEDDYSTILNLYPVSNHKAASAASSQMDQSIEKCRKCIKLHSIHVKPKNNSRKMRDPNYKQWLQQKEFNNQMWRAWMMLGQSEFHKGEFLESVGTFNYVSRLYDTDKNIVALCQLWVARAYGEMGWIYEAEDIVNKVNVDDISRKNLPFYSAVSADIALKGEHYREAIPFVKIARENETKKQYRPRFEFVLGELYEKDGQRAAAVSAYQRVNKMHTKDIELDFNARLRAAQLATDTTKSIRQMRHLGKLYKNKDKLDQIYGTIGTIYLNHGDTARALTAYEEAIAKSTQNGSHKAKVLLTAGDLYYERRQYAEAAPCYNEANQLLDHEHPAYPRVEKRNAVLADVVTHTQTIALQDSLQHLATLSPEEQMAVAERLVAALIEQEKQDSIHAAELAREEELEAETGGLKSVNTLNMLGGGNGDRSWYFYNAQLVKSGRQDFLKKWGNRPLEDNWRRKSKTMISSFVTPTEEETDEEWATDSLATDSLALDSVGAMEESIAQEMDPHQPQYYLQQIPKTDEDLALSNQQIADALYNLVGIYRDKMEDEPLTEETLREFERRFPQDDRRLDLYYMQYVTALKHEQTELADACKQVILTDYPDSHEAAIVGNPDYASAMRRMAAEQDSLYAATYTAYSKGQFAQVKTNKQYAETEYPLTPLMPRFLFLNAIAVAKTEGQDGFVHELQDMVQRYPTSELGAIAKDMLAMMGQGAESQQDGAASSLADKRGEQEQETDTIAEVAFSDERKEPAMVLIVLPQDEEVVNNLLYEVALFNFSQFLIKDFDIRALPIFMATQSAVQVSGFDSMDEAEWYIGLMQENTELRLRLQETQAQVVPITETNFHLLGKPFSLEDYMNR